MEDKEEAIEELIKTTKDNLVLNAALVNGPSYHFMNKMLAGFYIMKNEDLKCIFHLTESHAATLRQQTLIRYDYREDLIKKQQHLKTNNISHGIQKKYVEFDSEIALQEEIGLLNRLREMPKEWTVVQLTRQGEPQSIFTAGYRTKDFVPRPANIHIARLQCGEDLEERVPVRVLVDKPEETEGMLTVLDLIHQATKQLRIKQGTVREIIKARSQASQNIKEAVSELSNRVLREWKCLLLGRLCSKEREDKVISCIDNVIAKHPSKIIDKATRHLLYCVASGAVYLSPAELESAVCCLVDCQSLAVDLIRALEAFKEEMSVLLVARRHPVILIVDEDLDCLPWEIMNVLKNHPVSRVPSIHILHALFHEHKDHIVDGCRLMDRLDLGFYIVNPDQDLKASESVLVKFLSERIPYWKGVQGRTPTEEEFSGALTKNNVFVYCGHFNGSHIYHQDDISKTRVVALPLLFGCSSVALQNFGGRSQPSGVTDKYFMAGCACILGMLWSVMSEDTDCMTVTLLNSWLPGEPISLSQFPGPMGDLGTPTKEPELLRLLKRARDIANIFSNSAALIARGIPVRMTEDAANSHLISLNTLINDHLWKL